MQITFHGGRCCAIKHICWFQHWSPSMTMPAKAAKTSDDDEDSYDAYYDPTADGDAWYVDSSLDWFCEEAPAEPAEKRFERYVEFIRKHQPGCLVEVCLSAGSFCDYFFQWEAVIKKHGFEPVGSRFRNSNTGSEIQVYHLLIGG